MLRMLIFSRTLSPIRDGYILLQHKTWSYCLPNKNFTEPSPNSFTHILATSTLCQDENIQDLQKARQFCATTGSRRLDLCTKSACLVIGAWREGIFRKFGVARRVKARRCSGEMVSGAIGVRKGLCRWQNRLLAICLLRCSDVTSLLYKASFKVMLKRGSDGGKVLQKRTPIFLDYEMQTIDTHALPCPLAS